MRFFFEKFPVRCCFYSQLNGFSSPINVCAFFFLTEPAIVIQSSRLFVNAVENLLELSDVIKFECIHFVISPTRSFSKPHELNSLE